MNDGYINEGGQLKTKNGQKYTINERRPGVYVSRGCIIFTALLGVVAMIVIALLSYFLLSQQPSVAAVTGVERQQPAADTRSNASSLTLSARLFNVGDGDGGGGIGDNDDDRQSNNTDPTTTTIAALTSTTTDVGANILADDTSSSTTTTESSIIETTVFFEDAEKEDNGPENETIVQAEGWSPQTYRLVIEPRFEEAISKGSVEIDVTEDETDDGSSWAPIVLDINNITILNASVTTNHTGTSRPLPISADYGLRKETYIIQLLNRPPPGVLLTIHLHFISRLSDTLTGFYATTYRAYGVPQVMASTQFSPVDARRAFPCFDRPSKKAHFEISVVRHKNYTMALSNMPSIRTSTVAVDYIREDFNVTPRMSTYLVAFVVSNLVNAKVEESIDAPNLPRIRMWTRPQHQQQTQYVYTMTTRMLSYLDRYFNIEVGLPKIDLVAVPDFGFSAMENWGLITFRESGLLVASAADQRSVVQTKSVCKTLGHEIAHQWFGNLVTMRWWNDLWLKEGFSTYLSYITLNHVEPTWRVLDYFAAEEMQAAMRADADEAAHAISFPVQSSADIRRMFDPISYSKGATVVSMLNGILGDSTFRSALRAYLMRYKFDNAVQDDLWRIMTEQAHLYRSLPADMDVKTIMDTWTVQAGYPVLHVSRDPAAPGTVHFTQHRYILPEESRATTQVSNSSWFIPITVETARKRTRDTRPSHWLRPGPLGTHLTLHNLTAGPTDWLYANVRRVGYYRVNYDHGSWLLLSRNFNDVPAVTQGALIDDSLALAQAELLTYDVPLTMVLKLAKLAPLSSMGAVPWAAAEAGLQFVTDMLSREPANGNWRALMRHVLQPMYEVVGFKPREDEDTPVQKAHRVRVLAFACQMGVEECVRGAVKSFGEWMANADGVRLHPDLQSTILCTALRQGGANEWQFVYQRYVNQSSASEKEVLLNALGCTVRPVLLAQYLNMTLSAVSGIRKQDGARAFGAVAHNSVGNELAFDFLSANIEQFSKYYGDGFSVISRMIAATTTFASLPAQLAKYEAFAAEAQRLRLPAIEKSIRLQLPKVRNNVYWRQHRYYELEGFLRTLVEKLKLVV